jgi:hypothetical protein
VIVPGMRDSELTISIRRLVLVLGRGLGAGIAVRPRGMKEAEV